jgi:hypothetical protein
MAVFFPPAGMALDLFVCFGLQCPCQHPLRASSR